MSIETTADAGTGQTSAAWREPVLASAAGGVVLLASLVNYLGHNEYRLLTPEAGQLAAFFVLIAVGMGLVYALMSKLGRTLLQLVLVFLALDLNFELNVAIIGTVVIGIVLRRRMLAFLGIAASVVLVTGLLGLGSGPGSNGASQPPPPSHASQAPALVHVILDEHIGVEGILGDAQEAEAMRSALKAFYFRNGFRLFGGAYSEYLHTLNAIPQILNLGVEQSRGEPGTDSWTMRENDYFDRLRDLGYRVHVSQTDFLDLCENAAVVSCSTRRASDARDILDTSLSAMEKSRLLLNEMVMLSRLAQGTAVSYNLVGIAARSVGLSLPQYWPNLHRMPTAMGAMATYDRLIQDLRQAEPGDAFFVHELMPHYPYVVNARCELKPVADWRNRFELNVGRQEREKAYFEQISCLMTKLQAVFDALATSPAGANSIVILHGDHGSRITDIDPAIETESRFSDEDLIAGHSTLFAIRAAGIAPGYSSERIPAARLLAALAASAFSSAEVSLDSDMSHQVTLEDSQWTPVRKHDLPEWWARPQ